MAKIYILFVMLKEIYIGMTHFQQIKRQDRFRQHKVGDKGIGMLSLKCYIHFLLIQIRKESYQVLLDKDGYAACGVKRLWVHE